MGGISPWTEFWALSEPLLVASGSSSSCVAAGAARVEGGQELSLWELTRGGRETGRVSGLQRRTIDEARGLTSIL